MRSHENFTKSKYVFCIPSFLKIFLDDYFSLFNFILIYEGKLLYYHRKISIWKVILKTKFSPKKKSHYFLENKNDFVSLLLCIISMHEFYSKIFCLVRGLDNYLSSQNKGQKKKSKFYK